MISMHFKHLLVMFLMYVFQNINYVKDYKNYIKSNLKNWTNFTL